MPGTETYSDAETTSPLSLANLSPIIGAILGRETNTVQTGSQDTVGTTSNSGTTSQTGTQTGSTSQTGSQIGTSTQVGTGTSTGTNSSNTTGSNTQASTGTNVQNTSGSTNTANTGTSNLTGTNAQTTNQSGTTSTTGSTTGINSLVGTTTGVSTQDGVTTGSTTQNTVGGGTTNQVGANASNTTGTTTQSGVNASNTVGSQNTSTTGSTGSTGTSRTTGGGTTDTSGQVTNNSTTRTSADMSGLREVYSKQLEGVTPEMLKAIFEEGSRAAPNLIRQHANAVGARASNNSAVATALEDLEVKLTRQVADLNRLMLSERGVTAGKIAENTRESTTSGTQSESRVAREVQDLLVANDSNTVMQQLAAAITNSATTGTNEQTGTNASNTTGTNTQTGSNTNFSSAAGTSAGTSSQTGTTAGTQTQTGTNSATTQSTAVQDMLSSVVGTNTQSGTTAGTSTGTQIQSSTGLTSNNTTGNNTQSQTGTQSGTTTNNSTGTNNVLSSQTGTSNLNTNQTGTSSNTGTQTQNVDTTSNTQAVTNIDSGAMRNILSGAATGVSALALYRMATSAGFQGGVTAFKNWLTGSGATVSPATLAELNTAAAADAAGGLDPAWGSGSAYDDALTTAGGVTDANGTAFDSWDFGGGVEDAVDYGQFFADGGLVNAVTGATPMARISNSRAVTRTEPAGNMRRNFADGGFLDIPDLLHKDKEKPERDNLERMARATAGSSSEASPAPARKANLTPEQISRLNTPGSSDSGIRGAYSSPASQDDQGGEFQGFYVGNETSTGGRHGVGTFDRYDADGRFDGTRSMMPDRSTELLVTMLASALSMGMGGVAGFAKTMGKQAFGSAMKDGFADGGGPIKGPGTGISDSIPINASHGEFILPADTVAHVGVENLEKLVQETHVPADLQRAMIGEC